MSKKTERINIELIYCINQIEDFFEYHYSSYTVESAKERVMQYIDQMTKNLKKIDEEK